MRKPIVKLITFGAGAQHFKDAAERLIAQSKYFSAIDVSKAYSEADLPPDYYELFKGINGYGFFSWKPFLIHAELSKLESNDILIYIDAGCELNKNGIRRFNDYLSYTAKNDVLLFEQQLPNRCWTKNHPKLAYPEHFFRNILVGGIQFLKNNERSRQLIKAWLDLCSYENGILLRDPEANEPQLQEFIAHRHDQSCLSVSAYLHNIATIPDETWFQDWSDGKTYPILALRNRTGASTYEKKIKPNVFKRIKRWLKNFKNSFR
jgi:hypothetical protein